MGQIITREPVWVALFNMLKGIQYVAPGATVPGPLATYSRRLKHWSDVPADQQPALYLSQGNERHETVKPGLADKITARGKIYIYVQVQNDDGVPGTVLNPILDQLQALFPSATQNPMTGKQTLGGLVEHVLLQGEWLTFEGTLGAQEVCIVPLEILMVN